jgi:hypothetical protein
MNREQLLDAQVQALVGRWLGIWCVPPCPHLSYIPFKLLARTRGRMKLRDVLPRLRCEGCGGRPARALVVDDPRDDYCTTEPIAVLP